MIEPMERVNMGISAGAIAASFALASPHFASSLALGAALEAINFRFLNGSARAVFSGVVENQRMWMAVFSIRFGLLAGGIVAAFWAGAHPLGLVLGLSLVMPATIIAAIWNRPPVLEHTAEAAISSDDPSWDRYSIWRAGEVEPADEERE